MQPDLTLQDLSLHASSRRLKTPRLWPKADMLLAIRLGMRRRPSSTCPRPSVVAIQAAMSLKDSSPLHQKL